MLEGLGRREVENATLALVSGQNNIPLRRFFKRAFVVLLASGVALNAYVLWSQRQEIANGYADFTAFYCAGQLVASGRAADIYNRDVQYEVQRAVTPNVNIRHGALTYYHPSFEALLFVPLSHLPYFTAYLVWAGADLGMLFVAVWLIRSRLSGLQQFHPVLLLVVAVACFPVFMALFQGQDLPLLLLIVSAVYALLSDGAEFYAGCLLGLGTFRPELTLPIALVVAFNRGKRFSGGFVLSALAMAALSTWVVGWHGLVLYPRYVWYMERLHGFGSMVPAGMPNLRGLISLIVHSPAAALVITIMASIVSLSFATRALSKHSSPEQILYVAVLCALLVSYHGQIYDLTLLLLPFAFTYKKSAESPDKFSSTWSSWISLGSTAFFFCAPLLMWLWLRLGLLSLAAIVLLVWLISACREIVHPVSLTHKLAEGI